MIKPLMIDLYAGLGGWAFGGLAEGYSVIGFDIERWPYPGQLVLQNVLTLHGKQLKDVTVIVASPPCQKYSYMAMPWSRAKKMAAWYREDPERIEELNTLFNVCFRIQREASEAAGHKIPMIVENVKGAQKWVGRAKWHYGSYYLWGDVPALMPMTKAIKNPGHLPNQHMISSHSKNPVHDGYKNARNRWSDGRGSLSATTSGHSVARKAASALIAKIPFPLAQHIARIFKPIYL